MTQIPALPIPTLENSLSGLKTAVAPLLSQEERQSFQAICDQFLQEEGASLQQAFLQHCEQPAHQDNWMIEAWNDMYLSIRAPLYSDSNYALQINDSFLPIYDDPLAKLAAWLRQTVACYLESQQHPSDSYQVGQYQFCGINKNKLLGGYRIPQAQKDAWTNFSKTPLKTISLSYLGNVFSIKVLNENNEIISQNALLQQLQTIKADAERSDDLRFLSISNLGSDATANFLDQFLITDAQKQSYQALTEVICHVRLQAEALGSSEEICKQVLLGEPDPMWSYTPINFVAWEDGKLSAFVEHTASDACGVLRLLDEIKHISVDEKGFEDATLKQHVFSYSHEQEKQLQAAEKHKKEQGFSSKMLEISDIPSTKLGCSIDTLVQFMLHYAVYMSTGGFRSIYAAAALGNFKRGRTETLRSLSLELVDFIKQVQQDEKIMHEQLLAVAGRYKVDIKAAKQGLGFSRHLFMLNALKPSSDYAAYFFKHPALAKLNENMVSTSNLGLIGSPCDHFYFYPPEPSTLGVGYLTTKESVRLNVTYKKKNEVLFQQVHRHCLVFAEYLRQIEPK